jgi:hypothetical protein
MGIGSLLFSFPFNISILLSRLTGVHINNQMLHFELPVKFR